MKRINVLLIALLAASVAANVAVRPRPAESNAEFLPEMVRTAAYDSFAPNPNFPDGKTMQAPVKGAIPRGARLLNYTASPEDAVRAGAELQSPIAAGDAAALDRGAAVYNAFCLPCHGATGRGDGPVAMRGYPPPPSLFTDRALSMKDGQMFHILTYGQKNMPSYAAQIAEADRWKAILYVRSMQRKAAPK